MTTKPDIEMLGADALKFPISINIITPSAATYTIIRNSQIAFDIEGVDYKLNTGTLTAQVEIDTTDVQWTGPTGDLSVTNTAQDTDAVSANSVATTDNLELTLSSLSGSPDLLHITLHCVRTA